MRGNHINDIVDVEGFVDVPIRTAPFRDFVDRRHCRNQDHRYAGCPFIGFQQPVEVAAPAAIQDFIQQDQTEGMLFQFFAD